MVSKYPTAAELDRMAATHALTTPALHRWLTGAHTQAVRTEGTDKGPRYFAHKRGGKRIA